MYEEEIDKTLDIFGPNGEKWTKLNLETFIDPHYCLVGGLSKAIYGCANYDALDGKILGALTSKILELYPSFQDFPGSGEELVTYFNDAHSTTFDDVRTILEKVRAQENE